MINIKVKRFVYLNNSSIRVKNNFQGDFSEIKIADECFETLPEGSLPSTVSKKKKTIKMVGDYFSLRDVMDQSYPIYVCTLSNHGRYSSIYVNFCGSSPKHSLLK